MTGSIEDTVVREAPAELRLALVCYGGVSLAIYMHGVTKELHKLVAASRAFGRSDDNPYDEATDTEWAYFETLRDLRDVGRPVQVVVDIVAGTSAGGINGICLAQALACNGSQEELKRVWISEGDLKKLLVKNKGPLPGLLDDLALSVLDALGSDEPAGPLRGARMSRLLHEAIGKMSEPVPGGPASLLAEGATLELYVTTTDLDGFATLVPTGAGGASQFETDHHQVLKFAADWQGPGDFGRTAVGALAFAARATSSFPGAFPPVSIDSFARELAEEGVETPVDAAQIESRMQRRYTDGTHRAATGWFVDGGVLDNAPFDLAIQAIAERPARSEVLRRLIYIQPDPGVPPGLLPDAADPQPPTYLRGLLQALVSVRGSHSILPELLRLRDMNLRIAAVADLARLQAGQIAEKTRAMCGADAALHDLDGDGVQRLAEAVHGAVPGFVGAGYPGYCRLKVEAVAAVVAAKIAAGLGRAPSSNGTAFVAASLAAWARRHCLHDGAGELDVARLVERFSPVDLLYRERRLQFILAGVNELYPKANRPGGPRRAQLDALKTAAWALLSDLREGTLKAVRELGDATAFLENADVYADPEQFAVAEDEAFDRLYTAYTAGVRKHVAADTGAMWQAFVAHTGGWPESDRLSLLIRYLGFPLWDALLFPTLSLSSLPQYTPIRVSQYSPLAAAAIRWPEQKLKGVGLHHFAAFLDEDWRGNDYLWGRLDGAELVLRTLREVLAPATAAPPEHRGAAQYAAVQQAGPHLRRALAAVIGSEHELVPDGLQEAVDAVPDWKPHLGG